MSTLLSQMLLHFICGAAFSALHTASAMKRWLTVAALATEFLRNTTRRAAILFTLPSMSRSTRRIGGKDMLRLVAMLSVAVGAASMGAASAHADGDSYIRYLNDHGIFVPGINDAVRISRGSQVCTSLHNGMTPQQIIDANPIVYFDLRGVIDAAQHELCPDTLH